MPRAVRPSQQIINSVPRTGRREDRSFSLSTREMANIVHDRQQEHGDDGALLAHFQLTVTTRR